MLFSWLKKNEKQKVQETQYSCGHLSDGSKFYNGIPRSGSAPWFDVQKKRQNSRSIYESSPQARAVLRRLNDIVIDSGLVFKSSPIADIIGITSEQAEKNGEDLSVRFHMFMSSRCFTSNETMNGYQFSRMQFLGQIRDGEYFVKFNRKNKNKNSISDLSLQAIDPNRINSLGIVYTDGNNDYPDKGIYRDEYGKEIGYNITTRKKDGTLVANDIRAESSTGSKMMVHGFTQEYPDQLRGMSIISHELQEFSNLTDFDLSHIMKAIAQSQWVFATESDGEDVAFDPTENFKGGFGAGPIDFGPYDNTVTDSEVSDADTLIYKTIDEAQLRQPGSNVIVNAPPKHKVKMLGNTAPITNYPDFVQSFMSSLSASADIPLEVVLMKFSQNYSASRATLVLAWRVAGIYQAEFASDFLNEVLRAFVELEIASGRIRMPGFSDPVLRAAWLNCKWVGKPMPEIDPFKTMRGIELKTGMGLTDLDREAQEINGSDGKTNRQKLSKQYNELPNAPWSKAAVNKDGENV